MKYCFGVLQLYCLIVTAIVAASSGPLLGEKMPCRAWWDNTRACDGACLHFSGIAIFCRKEDVANYVGDCQVYSACPMFHPKRINLVPALCTSSIVLFIAHRMASPIVSPIV